MAKGQSLQDPYLNALRRSVSHHNNNGAHHAAQTSDAVAEVETQAE